MLGANDKLHNVTYKVDKVIVMSDFRKMKAEGKY